MDVFRYTCEACGQNLDLIYDYPAVRKAVSKTGLDRSGEKGIWRYAPLLPVSAVPRNLGIQVGGTPLADVTARFPDCRCRRLLVKDDTRNPSGSCKDRASEVALAHAGTLGQTRLIGASTGNAAASLACLSAWHGTEAIILVPAAAPAAKLVQIRQYGARMIPVAGNYDEAFDLAARLSDSLNLYNRNTGTNPVLCEGKKTAALEIAEQMRWEVPTKVLVPVGDGCILSGIHKGFTDLLNLGWTDRIPQLIAIQAEGSAAVANACRSGDSITAVEPGTVADSIAVSHPRDGLKALRAIRESGGFCLTVSDNEILDAQHKLARRSGIFTEPAAAAAAAGLEKMIIEDNVDAEDVIVLLATGSGLKDIPAAQRLLPEMRPYPADFGFLHDLLISHESAGVSPL